MANAQKYTRGQIGGLTRHYERFKKDDGQYQQFNNETIDLTRTDLNYNLAPTRDGGQLTFIGERTSEVQCLKRDDVNVMCSWLITAPDGLNKDEHKIFFQEAYLFLNNRYAAGSDANVISAYVHMDETTPHMHYAFVPVVHDEKKGIDKVSAKLTIDRKDLKTFHTDLEQHMARVFGREVGILNDATKDGNKTIMELKAKTVQADLVEIEEDLANERKALADVMAESSAVKLELPSLNAEKEKLQGQLEEIKSLVGTVKTHDGVKNTANKAREILKNAGAKTFGGSRIIKGDDYKRLETHVNDLEASALASPRVKVTQELKVATERVGRLIMALQKESDEKAEYKKKAEAYDALEAERNRKPNLEEKIKQVQISRFLQMPEAERMKVLNTQEIKEYGNIRRSNHDR